MNEKKFGLKSQGYVAPRAENVAVAQEGILCGSSVPTNLNGITNESFGRGANVDW